MGDPTSDSDSQQKQLFPKASQGKASWLASAEEFVHHENFIRFFRFGALDQNILLLGLLTGVGIDGFIHRRFGVAGYGPILGAGISNWVADAIATLPEGKHATAGISVGTLCPLIPVFIFMGLRHSFVEARAPPVLVGTIAASIFGIFAHEYRHSILPAAWVGERELTEQEKAMEKLEAIERMRQTEHDQRLEAQIRVEAVSHHSHKNEEHN
eukprot:TRINITY_DN4115_c0_g1_i1.p1 TRINITY_DN4115_c0_g1~~TRINITY_DN4115_c0_g1_i1.p1  ORF type:complete len:212 (+),score=32.49 TRINITY_DN4115_c0_g1_i1:15-650(+)